MWNLLIILFSQQTNVSFRKSMELIKIMHRKDEVGLLFHEER